MIDGVSDSTFSDEKVKKKNRDFVEAWSEEEEKEMLEFSYSFVQLLLQSFLLDYVVLCFLLISMIKQTFIHTDIGMYVDLTKSS